MKKEDIIKKTKQILILTDKICRRYKECDRGNIFHTLYSLEQPPLKRLELSIRRANLTFYKTRD